MSGIIQSSDVSTGGITADQLNRLYEDLIAQHNHVDNPIDHDNMKETSPIQGLTVGHAEADVHICGTGSFADNPGGGQGVHGLGTTPFVSGIIGGQYVAQWGIIPNTAPPTPATPGDVWRVADDPYPDTGTNYVKRNRFLFYLPYDEPPDLCMVLFKTTSGATATYTVYQRLRTSFAFKIRFADNHAERANTYWPTVNVLAIGKMVRT